MNWKKEFDEEFGKPKPYKPRDRRMSQLQHAFNEDMIGEAIDDERERQAELMALGYQDLYDRTKAFIQTLLEKQEKEMIERIRKDFIGFMPLFVKPSKKKEFLKWLEFFNSILELALDKALKGKE
jgi:hypothetical protein